MRMAASPVLPPEPIEPEHRPKHRLRKSALIFGIAALLLCIAVIVWVHVWPFEEGPIVQRLQQAADSRVQVQKFHRTYLPYPGCVLDNVVFTRGNAPKPLITIQHLTIESNYIAILSHRVTRIVAEGAHAFIPMGGTGQPFHAQRSTVQIDEIFSKDAVIEIERAAPHRPLRFDIHEIALRNVGANGPLTYNVNVHNPDPPAEITAQGKYGPWNESAPAETPLSGEYKMERADLSIYHAVAGMLSSQGKFEGKLGHIDISGSTDTPDFEVKSGHHPVDLKTDFTAYVDATNGDTFLKHVDAYFHRTHLVADGSIAKPKDGKGKVALIRVSSDDGRIEDVLGLFDKEPRSPMSGELKFHANVQIPPGKKPFLEKVDLRGGFGIGGGEFPNPKTQKEVDKLSAGAEGDKNKENPETVMTNLEGQVALTGGVAHFNDITFGVPGAKARLRGTYSLLNHRIDLRGQMKVDTEIANTTTGVKALLLKVMGPFFKHRKHGGQILPVKIAGTYEKPTFGLDIEDEKAEAVPAPHTHRGPKSAAASRHLRGDTLHHQ